MGHDILKEMSHFSEQTIWLGSTLFGLVLLWWMEVDKRKATILILVTAVPALVGGPIFLLMVLGRTVFGHRRGWRGH